MKPRASRHGFANQTFHCVTPLFLALLVLLNPAFAQTPPPPAQSPPAQSQLMSNQEESPKIPNDQLDSLVAPIALYPDPLLAQMLAASTYPLEVIQLEQWLKKNPNLKQEALAAAVAKQPWDPSVQSLAIYPDVITRLSENVAWTTDLGNAFLAQQSDLMAAVQRMRAKAQAKGALKTSEQQKVETEPGTGGQEIITIEPANPQYVYVPSYDPVVVYGPPVYPYPYYSYPGYVPGMGLAFGTGLVLGAAWANNWGNCNWNGGGDVTINNNNNFNKNNINKGNNNKWQHNGQHRGGAPYGDRGTANKYGGRARQQSAGSTGNRPGGGGAGAGNVAGGNRPRGGAGAGNIGGDNRPGGGAGGGNFGGRDPFAGGITNSGNAGGGTRPGAGGAGTMDRPGGGGAGNRVSTGTGGGGNSVGSRRVSEGSGVGSSSNAFGGGDFGGGSARSASSRGGSSMGGGGFSHGGGGGGGRGGGGGGRSGGGGGGRR